MLDIQTILNLVCLQNGLIIGLTSKRFDNWSALKTVYPTLFVLPARSTNIFLFFILKLSELLLLDFISICPIRLIFMTVWLVDLLHIVTGKVDTIRKREAEFYMGFNEVIYQAKI